MAILESVPTRKGLPHSEESERAVLGAILLDPESLATVAGRLKVEDFYAERHRHLYDAMLAIGKDGVAIDLRTLQAELERRDRLSNIGGLAYLAELDLDLPDIGRIDAYIEIVKERSIRRQMIEAAGTIVRNCLDGGTDAAEALGHAEQAILGLGEQAVRRGFVSLSDALDDTLSELEERQQSGYFGIPSGFTDLDDMTRGMGAGHLLIVAGRPGMGKTSLALNIAENVAIRERKPVAVFSLEMSYQELALRVLSAETGIPFKQLRVGHLSQGQWSQVFEAQQEISSAPLFIDDSGSLTLLELSSKARRMRVEFGLELLIVDYLQLMQAGGRYENRNLEVSAITRGLKQLAKEIGIPVMALSQLSRQTERRSGDHRPQLADLRESGSIEQDADLVAFVYREEVYDPETEDKGMAELIIAKHRHGETGTVPLVFLGENTKFLNYARHAVPPPGPEPY